MKIWTILNTINWATECLRSRGIGNSRLDAELLLSHVLNIDRIGLYINYDKPLDNIELNEFKRLIERRVCKEPIFYILGYREFWSIKVKVDKRVLIPRPDTELLVEEVLKIIKYNNDFDKNQVNILDIGTGSGVIAISLAKEINNSKISAVDISKDAIELALENAKTNFLDSNIIFYVGDLFSPFDIKSSFDIIVSNPPYISEEEWGDLPEDIRIYEPRIGLYGGKDGLYFLKKIISEAPLYLKDKGWLILEIGYNQGDKVKNMFNESGYFYTPEIIKDYGGFNRVVKAQKRWIS
jgi:release factor glutamine methyltransferase